MDKEGRDLLFASALSGLLLRVTRIYTSAIFGGVEPCTLALELKGHAHFAPPGLDILCAAVSVLAENLANSLKTLLKLPAKIEAHKGLYMIRLSPKYVSKESELLFASTLLGLGVLAGQYPGRIEIKEKEHGS